MGGATEAIRTVRALIAAHALSQADAVLSDALRHEPASPDLLYLHGVVANKPSQRCPAAGRAFYEATFTSAAQVRSFYVRMLQLGSEDWP